MLEYGLHWTLDTLVLELKTIAGTRLRFPCCLTWILSDFAVVFAAALCPSTIGPCSHSPITNDTHWMSLSQCLLRLWQTVQYTPDTWLTLLLSLIMSTNIQGYHGREEFYGFNLQEGFSRDAFFHSPRCSIALLQPNKNTQYPVSFAATSRVLHNRR